MLESSCVVSSALIHCAWSERKFLRKISELPGLLLAVRSFSQTPGFGAWPCNRLQHNTTAQTPAQTRVNYHFVIDTADYFPVLFFQTPTHTTYGAISC